MKILILTDRFPPFVSGGYERRCKETACALAEIGHKILILTTTFGLCCQNSENGIHRILLRNNNNYDLRKNFMRYLYYQVKKAFYFRENSRIVEKVVKDFSPDIVYIWQMWDIGTLAVHRLAKSRIPIVFHVGDYWLSDSLLRQRRNAGILRKWLRTILTGVYDFEEMLRLPIIAISNAVKKEYVKAGFFAQNIRVIPRGIIKEHILSKLPSKDMAHRIKLLCVGRLVNNKGIEIAIKAVNQLKIENSEKDIVLDIFGDGDVKYVNELKKLVNSFGLASNIKFMNVIPNETMITKYSDYNLLLFPSIWEEPLGVVALEAMAKAVPVVASEIGGIPEMVKHEQNGLLFSAGNYIECAEAIKRLIEDDVLYKRLCVGALETVSKKFVFSDSIREIEMFLVSNAKHNE
jgi:glycosyltransferase involved in cell wall biosynthesis